MKAPDAFRTISEVAEDLDLPQHVLRFWETRFSQIKPMKRGGGRRYYRPDDIDLLRGIRTLLYAEGFTIRGVQRLLKERGVAFVAGVGQAGSAEAGDGEAAPEIEPVRRPEIAAEPDLAADADFAPEHDVRPALDPRSDPGFAPEHGMRAQASPELRPFGAPAPRLDATAAPAGSGLSQSDRRRIDAVLADLLEAKRLLDQVR